MSMPAGADDIPSLLDNADLSRGEEAAGWLFKKGAVRHNWKRRWFVLRRANVGDGELVYFKGDDCAERKGSIDLDGAKIRRRKDTKHRNHFEIRPKTDKSDRVYELYADSEKELRYVCPLSTSHLTNMSTECGSQL